MNTPVEIAKPDITPLKNSHDGIDWVTFMAAAARVRMWSSTLIHGNEISGPQSLLRLLDTGLRPAIGRLSLALANIEAFFAFDPADPTATRFLDEDMNRLWTREARRAAATRASFAAPASSCRSIEAPTTFS
ncbi:MAG: hypothetical protein R3C97_17640 [Geminicoccaceae bacterium]